jgi:trimethylamine--corrinoid protein Co-methyltransferase
MMIKRVRQGFDFSPQTMAVDEIKKIGPAGVFAANPETLERMTTATFMPEIADRKLRESWAEEGSSTIHQRAMDKALDILSTSNSDVLDEQVDSDIRNQFENLVSGDAVVPQGWTRAIPARETTRKRRVNRRRGAD